MCGVKGHEVKNGRLKRKRYLTSGGFCRAKCYAKIQAKNGRGGGKACTGKEKEDAGREGGRKSGASKKRFGVHNHRTRLTKSKPSTWKTFGLTFPKFQYLLAKLHHGRENNLPKPYLKKSGLPKWIANGLENIDKILETMNGTKFGHPDRFKDFVSKEIVAAMRQEKHRVKKSPYPWWCGSVKVLVIWPDVLCIWVRTNSVWRWGGQSGPGVYTDRPASPRFA